MSEEETKGDGIQVIPFYFVCDVSGSMAGEPIAAVNRLLPTIKSALQQNPFVADLLRVGLITFSDDVSVDLPLSNLLNIETLPTLTIRGGTIYSGALKALKAQIISDYDLLNADGYQIRRPIVLFLSDGAPMEDRPQWESAFDELTDAGFPRFPNVVPIGIGQCDREIIKSLIHRKPGDGVKNPSLAIFVDETADVGAVLSEIIDKLTQSLVNSAAKVAQGQADDKGVMGTLVDELAPYAGE